ncbi:MAG: hypothetical protein GF401_14630 [Chitinivibrionales bacterium]|nr:hypothetical protein [Chitinivibrionales bacterium]
MNILVIRFSSMGDVILTAPVFTLLRSRYPGATIILLTRHEYGDIFRDDPRINRILSPKKGEWPSELSDIVWDKIIDLQANSSSRRVIRKLNTNSPVARFRKLHFERLLLLLLRIDCYKPEENVVYRYAKAAGYSEKEHGALPLVEIRVSHSGTGIKNKTAEIMNQGKPILALMPFSAWKNKEWPITYYAETGRYFISRGWNIAILGGPEEREKGISLKNMLGPAAFSFAGELSIGGSAELLARCSLALGNDTGLSHLARASGVETGIIYGATTRHFGFFPYGKPPYAIFEEKIWCRPCHPHGGNICLRYNKRSCLFRIKPDVVVRRLEALAGDR